MRFYIASSKKDVAHIGHGCVHASSENCIAAASHVDKCVVFQESDGDLLPYVLDALNEV